MAKFALMSISHEQVFGSNYPAKLIAQNISSEHKACLHAQDLIAKGICQVVEIVNAQGIIILTVS